MARCRGPVNRLLMMRKRGLGGVAFQNVGSGCMRSVGAFHDANGPLSLTGNVIHGTDNVINGTDNVIHDPNM